MGNLDQQCQQRLSQLWADGRPVTAVVGVVTPDLQRLDPAVVRSLADVFDQHSDLVFRPPNEAVSDPTRRSLDRATAKALLLPDTVRSPLATLRAQWCAEPSVHGGKYPSP